MVKSQLLIKGNTHVMLCHISVTASKTLPFIFNLILFFHYYYYLTCLIPNSFPGRSFSLSIFRGQETVGRRSSVWILYSRRIFVHSKRRENGGTNSLGRKLVLCSIRIWRDSDIPLWISFTISTVKSFYRSQSTASYLTVWV